MELFSNVVSMGDLLASFTDSGKGVILAVFAFNGYSQSPSGSFSDYYCINNGNNGFITGRQTLGTFEANHPIMAGVTSFDGGSSSYRSGTFNPASEQVASWTDGTPLVATRLINNVRRVDLGFFPPSSDARSDFWQSNTNGVTIMVNAINWVTGSAPVTTGVPPPIGVPCTADWQCPNSNGGTYATCVNSLCKCSPGFTGSATEDDPCVCDSPSNIVWNNNAASCLAAGLCSGGRDYLCNEVSDDPNFVSCVNGVCMCEAGFGGRATSASPCSCSNSVVWVPTCPA